MAAVKSCLLLLLCLVVFSSCSPFEEILKKHKSDTATGTNWALIVAGSSGWYNYRHQADVCHAYQILKTNGFKDENIVVMMYDDIAENTLNPTPGIIINHPHGFDVYHGVPKDYTRRDVTPQNFLDILRGKSHAMEGIGSGKVIASGPEDNVFVNFVDHGAPGILGFPHEMLHKADLLMALEEMYENKQFNKMVLYVEACESGSIFEGSLPSDWNIFASTAANSHQSSYACYYDKKRKTYLGDVYSVNWLHDSTTENLKVETLQEQFLIVKKQTNTSHVMEYGDLKISKLPVADFQAAGNMDGMRNIRPAEQSFVVPSDAVPQEDVPLAILYHQLHDSTSVQERQIINQQILELYKLRMEVEKKMDKIIKGVTRNREQANRVNRQRVELTKHTCYKTAVNRFHDICYNLGQNNYALRNMYKLLNLCEEGIDADLIERAIFTTCVKH
ncbi:legumain-like isoform X2 [Tubulanus polymorphus]|uniref:legumain-like isoform X2 n=1 Tax=Tubulanus polymorphus TaxID=672921 RepID=UPI003DA5FDDB